MGSGISSSKKDCRNSGDDNGNFIVSKLVDSDAAVNVDKLSESQSNVEPVDVYCIGDVDVTDFIESLILSKKTVQSFFVVDLTQLELLYQSWKRLLPRVEVFYAVKCSPDTVLIRLLNKLGSNFDCASDWEIQLVMAQGVSASRIIFANPCKPPNQMVRAEKLGVRLTTFDTHCELEKLRRYAPDAKTLLRIRADDPTAMHSIGKKFGAEMKELPGLYAKAKALGVDVVGVCFHIGTGARDPKAFTAAITLAREAFDIGLRQGFNMSILDIGGGFSSGSISPFEDMASAVNAALDSHFPVRSGVRIIAEPGRYLMETCTTLACNIFGVRERTIDGVLQRDYWIPDGIHGSFCPLSGILTRIKASPLKFSQSKDEETIPSTVFGPTLDGDDFVLKDVNLPKLFVDDWLLFHDMGAYTSALSSNFNGMHNDKETVYVRTGVPGSV